jgi:hypothetical protein
MMRLLGLLFFVFIVSACDGQSISLGSSDSAGQALNEKAIEVGAIPDPSDVKLAGRFETRSELGTDKFCAVGEGGSQHKIGVLAVFGPESKCEGQGSARVKGEVITIDLTGQDSCRFDAEYDGISLRFPGAVPDGCASYCTPRASLAGTSYFIVEHGDENARKALGRDIEKLCS